MIKLIFYLTIITVLVAQANISKDRIIISKEEYKERRQKLIEKMPENPIVLVGNTNRNRINDTEFEFRQESNFYYLSGFNEADAYMILSNKPFSYKGKEYHEVIFVPENNLQALTWTGKRLGTLGAMETLGFDLALPVEEYESFLENLVLDNQTIAVNTPKFDTKEFGTEKSEFGQVQKNSYIESLKTFLNEKIKNYAQKLPKDSKQIIIFDKGERVKIANIGFFNKAMTELRGIKSQQEIKVLQEAINVTHSGHLEAFKISNNVDHEYQVEAAVEYAFKFNGAEAVGYGSIVGCGENGTILHYQTNRDKINKNQMFVVDAGAEYENYTADITRSFPANGKFNKEQTEIYNLVLEAQKAGEKKLVPGKKVKDVSDTINTVFLIGLKKLGIIKEDKQLKEVYPHGWGHHVGLDVHDAGEKVFQEGMVWTIEPGIYISKRISFEIDKKYMDIAVRIEDMYVIEKNTARRMSKDIPREINEIEKVMKEKSSILLNK